jgi:glycosyltransferase involved in cell wall biosynthesis
MFWPAMVCSQIDPSKSLLWTCLHDEPYVHYDIVREEIESVAGLFFQTEPELELAHQLTRDLAPRSLVGCGVEVPSSYDPASFRSKYGLGDRPFILYAGRREGAKGWDDLVAAFAGALRRSGSDIPLSLVSIGAGPVNPPADIADRVIDLGFLPDDDRDNAYAAATAYVQPSRYEAFSRTIMESWLAGRPVIGFGNTGVVHHHIVSSQAGLSYEDEFEFEAALRFLTESPESAAALGAAGRRYVLENYQWPDVLDRVERAISTWTPAAAPQQND